MANPRLPLLLAVHLIVWVAGLAATIVFICGCERHAQIEMVCRHVKVCLAGRLCLKINGQVAVYQRRVTREVVNTFASDGIDGIDAIFRFV